METVLTRKDVDGEIDKYQAFLRAILEHDKQSLVAEASAVCERLMEMVSSLCEEGLKRPFDAPASVFIAHSGEQKSIYKSLLDKLLSAGTTAFLDKESLPPGCDAPEVMLQHALRCQYGVVVCSKDFLLKSPDTLFELFVFCIRLRDTERFQGNFTLIPDFFSREMRDIWLGKVQTLPLPQEFKTRCGIRHEHREDYDHVDDTFKKLLSLLNSDAQKNQNPGDVVLKNELIQDQDGMIGSVLVGVSNFDAEFLPDLMSNVLLELPFAAVNLSKNGVGRFMMLWNLGSATDCDVQLREKSKQLLNGLKTICHGQLGVLSLGKHMYAQKGNGWVAVPEQVSLKRTAGPLDCSNEFQEPLRSMMDKEGILNKYVKMCVGEGAPTEEDLVVDKVSVYVAKSASVCKVPFACIVAGGIPVDAKTAIIDVLWEFLPESYPHMTKQSFFKIEDMNATALDDAMRAAMEEVSRHALLSNQETPRTQIAGFSQSVHLFFCGSYELMIHFAGLFLTGYLGTALGFSSEASFKVTTKKDWEDVLETRMHCSAKCVTKEDPLLETSSLKRLTIRGLEWEFWPCSTSVAESRGLLSIGVMSKTCAVCGIAGPKRCGNCREANYCSVEHQKLHWPQHRKACQLRLMDQNASAVERGKQRPVEIITAKIFTTHGRHMQSPSTIPLNALDEHAVRGELADDEWGKIQLIRASALLDASFVQQMSNGQISLPKYQDVNSSFFLQPSEAKFRIFVSHPWTDAQHPDYPSGLKMSALAHMMREYQRLVPLFGRNQGSVGSLLVHGVTQAVALLCQCQADLSEIGLFIDFCCIPQGDAAVIGPLLAEQQKAALLMMQRVVSSCSLAIVRRSDDDYERRGWCVAETASSNPRRQAIFTLLTGCIGQSLLLPEYHDEERAAADCFLQTLFAKGDSELFDNLIRTVQSSSPCVIRHVNSSQSLDWAQNAAARVDTSVLAGFLRPSNTPLNLDDLFVRAFQLSNLHVTYGADELLVSVMICASVAFFTVRNPATLLALCALKLLRERVPGPFILTRALQGFCMGVTIFANDGREFFCDMSSFAANSGVDLGPEGNASREQSWCGIGAEGDHEEDVTGKLAKALDDGNSCIRLKQVRKNHF